MFLYIPFSSFAAMLFTVVILWANHVIQVENKSVFGIGKRNIGDQLLLKDVLHTPPISLTEEPVIKFNYAINEPITYIQIESDKNVYAVVDFSYENEIVQGQIFSVNLQESQQAEPSRPEPFEVLIQIYGFNKTFPNVDTALIVNKNQLFNGVMKPNYQQNHQSLSLMEEDLNVIENFQDNNEDDYGNDDDDDDDDDDIDVVDEEDFDDEHDKIIAQGERQEGDFLVYETNQTSHTSSELPSNHSITFYYIDIFYITYVKFTIYEHYLDNSLDNHLYEPPVVEYAHISPTTLKAVVTDYRTTSLFVQMQMYGFHPSELPVDYKPFLPYGPTATTTRPISAVRQLKLLMNAQQTTDIQQKHDSAIEGTDEEQQQLTQLDHQISPIHNSNVNCLEQDLSREFNIDDSRSIFTHHIIFNLMASTFAIIVLT